MDDFDPSRVASDSFDPSKVLPAAAPRGALGEIGTAFARGAAVDLPTMTGQALQYVSSPGGAVYKFGKGLVDNATARGAAPALTLHPEEHGAVINALASGAQMAPSILAPAAAVVGGIAAAPVELPALAATAITAGAIAAPFAAQAGQQTLEKAQKAGLPEDAATTTSRLNAGLTFATQFGLGMIGGNLFGATGRLFGRVVQKDGADLAAQTLADLTGRSGVIAPFAKAAAASAVEGTAVGAAQAGGSAAIEKNAGIDNTDPWQAALDSVPQMLGLNAIMAPLGLAARAIRANALAKRASALESKDTAPQIRDQLATQYFTELNKVDPQAAEHFAYNANLAIQHNLPLEVDRGLFQQGAVTLPNQDTTFQGPEAQRALPAPAQRTALPRGKLPEGVAEDTGPTAADFNAQRITEQRQAEENRQALVATHGQVVDELKAAGVAPQEALSFPAFRDAMAAEAAKAGLKASDITPDEYQRMWEQHQQDVMNANFGKAQEHAFKLAEGTRSKLPTESSGGAPKTALTAALEDAVKQHQMNEAFKQRDAQRQAQLDQLQNVGRGGRLADAAEKGATPAGTKTLPATAERVVQELRTAKTADQNMPPRLIKEVSGAITGKGSLEDQLVALRTLRDAKDPKTASHELVDKLYQKLGGDDALREQGAAEVDVRKPSGDGKAVAGGDAAGGGSAVAGEGKGAGGGEKTKIGRPKGTTDDRHTIGPPNEVGELLPHTRTLSQARDGANGGIFGEKQWWQDLAWAVRNPETKIGKELLENGKITNEQIGQALERDERYQKTDALLEKMRQEREARLREQMLADAQPEAAKEILRARDLVNIFGGDESDYAFEKKAQTGDDPGVRELFAKGVSHKVSDVLVALQRLAKEPAHKALIDALQKLKLGTTMSLVDRPLRGGQSQGLYNEIFDHLVIGQHGARVDTILHEIVHAATLPKLDEGMALLRSLNNGEVKFGDLTPDQRRLAGAADDLTNLYLDASARDGAADHYGMAHPYEFVAEALSSKSFQEFLNRGGEKSLWTRFVDAVKQILGLKTSGALLSRALAVSKEFFAGTKERTAPEGTGLGLVQKFMEGPTSAAKQTDTVLDRVAKVGDAKLSIKQGFTRAQLAFTTLNHIRQVFKDVLPKAYAGALDAYGSAKDRIKQMVEERNRGALELSRQMSALADKQPGLDIKLYRLMGEATRHGIFPDKTIAEQPWSAKKSTAEKIRKYNELRSVYQSNPDLRAAYDSIAAFNKADYDRIYATVVRNLGRYSDMPRELWSKIDVTKGRSAEVQGLEKWLLANGSDEQRLAMRGAQAQYREKQQGPYFHLGRNGSYFTRFTVKDNPAARAAYEKEFGVSPLSEDRVVAPEDRHVFARFEAVGEWKNVADKLNKLRDAGHLEDEMQAGQLETMIGKLDSSSPSFIRGLLRNIEADTRLDPDQKLQAQDVLRRLSVEMLPETSASKAFAQRKGVAGYDVDMNRSFVKRAASTAYFVAHNSIRPEVEDSLLQLKQGVKALQDATSPHYDNNRGLVASALQNEIKQREANDLVATKTPILDNVSALSHSFYLAANPAFFMMKTLQPWQLALPQMGARHGFVRSFAAMTKATATALSIIKDTIGDGWQRDQWRGLLDPNIVIDRAKANAQEKGFLRALIAAGGATFTQAHDMGNIAAGESQGISTAVKLGNASLHYSEALDRMTAGLAAFNLELKRTNDVDKATQYGIQMVKNSLYDYNTHNKGRMFSKQGMFGPATPLLTQFAQYQIQTLEMMGRLTMDAFGKVSADMTPAERDAAMQQRGEARRALAGLMGTTLVLAGTLGLPGVAVLTAAYNSLFSTKDAPADVQTDYRNFLSDTFGKDVGEIIAHGTLRATGTDLGAQHLGFQDIIPFSRFLADRRKLQDRFDSGALSMMGPAVGAASGFAFGVQNMLLGRYMKGLEEMLPSGLKGVTKAADLAAHGATDLQGNKLPVDVNSWDIFAQALNTTPSKIAEQREAQHGASTTTMLLKQRSQSLEENFAVAAERGDGDEMKTLTDQIVEFNRQNPDYAVRDLAGIIRRRAIERAVAEQSNVEGRVRQLPRLQSGGRFANTRGMP